MNQPSKPRSSLLFLVLLLVICLLFYGVLFSGRSTTALQYSDVLDLFRQEQVESFVLDGGTLHLRLRGEDGATTTASAEIGDVEAFHSDLDDLIGRQYADHILTSYDYQAASTPWLRTVLTYVLIGAAFLFIWFLLSRNAGGGNAMARFTKANARFGAPDKEPVTFADVAGADEEKAELAEIVAFLREPGHYRRLGARIPKGVLLVGPPGTGKTLLARAVAGEAGVSFLSISGSDFVELYVGVGASRVRDLFDQAKKVSPTIVFIDEIDAVGRRRGAGMGGGNDEREQTLNQLLVEMDGFAANEGIVVIAATNRKDILDPALLRPGRFDRQIYVSTPDRKGRCEILKVHARSRPLAEDVDLDVLARQTAGFTGADLANLLNEGALLAARQQRPVITMGDLQEALIKVIAGPEKKSRVVTAHERRLTAFHEAGHAVAMHALPTQDPVHMITIIPRGAAGGMTISLPTEDASYSSRSEMFETIVGLLGGRVAEQLKLEDISTGASNDMERATAIARDMAAKYGMTDSIGPVCYDAGHELFLGRDYEKTKPYSERVAGEIDAAVHEILLQAYTRCEEILRRYDAQLDQVARFLLDNDTMSGEEFETIMAKEEQE